MAREKEKKIKMKQSVGSRVFDICNAVFMIAFCITIILPFWDVIVRSFSRAQDISYMHINLFPKVWTLDAYKYCFQDNEILTAFGVSVLRTIIGTFIHVIVCCMAAYSLTRTEMPFRRIITAILLIPMFFSAGMIPAYINMKRLGLLNNFLVYVLPTGFSIYNTIIIRNYFFSIDKGMEEAASIDGASQVRIFASIIMPLSKPVIASISLFYGVGFWNDYFNSMIYLQTAEKFPIQIQLRSIILLSSTFSDAMMDFYDMNGAPPDKAVKMACTVIATVPVLCIYPFVQKYFTKGVMVGAVKG